MTSLIKDLSSGVKVFLRLAVCAGALACATFLPSARVQAEEQIKIGLLLSLSDEWAEFGRNMLNGAKLAQAEIEAAGELGSKRLVFLTEDTREANSGSNAVSAYRSLRLRGVNFFVGPSGTPAGLALKQIVTRDPVVMLGIPGVAEFTEASANIFNPRGVDAAATRNTARYAIERGWRTAAVLVSQQPWEARQGEAFKEEFERRGGIVAALESPLPDMQDLRGPLTNLLATKPDVIFLGNTNRLALAVKQLAALGYSGPKLSVVLYKAEVEMAHGLLEGTVFSTLGAPSADFSKRYQARFGIAPGLGADCTYDAVRALAEAIKSSGSLNPQQISSALSQIHFQGSGGEFSFDSNRVAKHKIEMFKVAGGEFVPLR